MNCIWPARSAGQQVTASDAHKLSNGAIGEGEVAQKNTPMILGAMVQHRRDERDPENPIPAPNQVHETRALIVH